MGGGWAILEANLGRGGFLREGRMRGATVKWGFLLPIYGWDLCNAGVWRGVGGCSGEERTRAGQRSYIPSIPASHKRGDETNGNSETDQQTARVGSSTKSK